MKVNNKGGIGNPNHDPNTGEFTSGENGVKESEQDSDFGNFQLFFDVNSIDDFLDSFEGGLTKKERERAANEILGKYQNEGYTQYTNYNEINLSKEEKVDFIVASNFGYDKEKISSLSNEEIEAIYISENLIYSGKQIEGKIALKNLEKNQVITDTEKECEKAYFETVNGEVAKISDVWYETKNIYDYEELAKKDEYLGTSRIDRKRKYYEDIINDTFALDSAIEEAKNKLNLLDNFVKEGEKYLSFKNKAKELAESKIKDIDSEIEKYNQQLKYVNSDDFQVVIKEAKDFLNNYIDKNSAYSKERKDKAVWFNSDNGYKNTKAAQAYFKDKMNDIWKNKLTPKEQFLLVNYTGSGFSKFNKPLRGIKHDPYGYSFNENTGTFSQAVTEMTNAIDKCTWDDDIWVQRGISANTKIFSLPGSKIMKSIDQLSESELQSLVGTSFTDNGFYSAGAGKHTGMEDYNLIINTYCPKGTKMAYMGLHGNFADTTENEVILQRGYTYRITKVEKKNSGQYYIDVEVVLDSDSSKPIGNKLKELGNKYYYEPRKIAGEKYE